MQKLLTDYMQKGDGVPELVIRAQNMIESYDKRVRHNFLGGGRGSIPGESMLDLWWTKWHWDRFFSEKFGFF